jgi:hypothetical protein
MDPFVMELLLFFAKGENPLDVDFERAKLIDEKNNCRCTCCIYKEGVRVTVLVLSSNGWIVYQCK